MGTVNTPAQANGWKVLGVWPTGNTFTVTGSRGEGTKRQVLRLEKRTAAEIETIDLAKAWTGR